MYELDKELEKNPEPHDIIEMAELGIRNRLCFIELESFNKTGKFLYKHPLIKKDSLRTELMNMIRRDPKEFLDEYKNVSNNITRYQSFMNKKKAKPEEKNKWQKQLEKHTEKLSLMTEITQQMNYSRNS